MIAKVSAGCAFCSARVGAARAAGWTLRTLSGPVTFQTIFGGGATTMPAGNYRVCPVCSGWLADHRDRDLPPAVRAGVNQMVAAAGLHPATARRLRAELVGMVRHLAEAFTGPSGQEERV